MADNITYANTGTGAIPNSTQIRSRQNSNGQHIQVVDVAPFQASAVAGGQYAVSVGTTAVSLTVPATATHALVSVDVGANTIRWTRDGTSPTTAVGHALQAGDMIEVENLSNFKMISTTGTSTVQVSYHRYV